MNLRLALLLAAFALASCLIGGCVSTYPEAPLYENADYPLDSNMIRLLEHAPTAPASPPASFSSLSLSSPSLPHPFSSRSSTRIVYPLALTASTASLP